MLGGAVSVGLDRPTGIGQFLLWCKADSIELIRSDGIEGWERIPLHVEGKVDSEHWRW